MCYCLGDARLRFPFCREGNGSNRHGMNPGPKLLRWLKVTLLGCALGLFFVATDLAVWSVLSYVHGHARSGPPLRLSAGPVQQELTRIINSQLSAFRKGDYAGAYAFADSALQAQVSPAVFERMVKSGYPAIARSRSASFGVSLDNGAEAIVTVGVMSQSGHLLQYHYLMRHEPNGWRISGVVRVHAEGITV
jgi:Domain of unknown function (DUF4864)